MWRCRIFGHRPRFRAEGRTMLWECERGCGFGGQKDYADGADAARYAAAFDKEDSSDLGRRPLLSLLPLGLARKLGRR